MRLFNVGLKLTDLTELCKLPSKLDYMAGDFKLHLHAYFKI